MTIWPGKRWSVVGKKLTWPMPPQVRKYFRTSDLRRGIVRFLSNQKRPTIERKQLLEKPRPSSIAVTVFDHGNGTNEALFLIMEPGIYQMSIGHVSREMSEEGLLGPLDGYLVKPLQGGRLFEVNATAAGMNQSFAGKRLGSRCRERFGEVTVSLYAFFDWLSLNQTWSNHINQSDEAKISGAAKESSMQKHVNSFKRRKTRVSNSRLVWVLNIILRKGASSLDQSQSEDQGLLGATSKYVLIGRNFNPSSLSNSACVLQNDRLRFNFRSISLAEARKISYLRFNFRHKVRFKD